MDKSAAPFRVARAEQTCFVYDVRTGIVVHIHQFCPLEAGGRCSEAEMEQTAIALAPDEFPRDHLATLQVSGDVELRPGHLYHVDRDRQTFRAEPISARGMRGRQASE